MEDLLFGSDLEDSEDEGKVIKGNKAEEREAQLNELFGDSPSEGEEEDVEHGGEASESDKDEVNSGDEKEKERKITTQERDEEDEEEREDDYNEEENEVRAGKFTY